MATAPAEARIKQKSRHSIEASAGDHSQWSPVVTCTQAPSEASAAAETAEKREANREKRQHRSHHGRHTIASTAVRLVVSNLRSKDNALTRNKEDKIRHG
eukprot:1800431-Pleurochrysis_carterae.AAC.1